MKRIIRFGLYIVLFLLIIILGFVFSSTYFLYYYASKRLPKLNSLSSVLSLHEIRPTDTPHGKIQFSKEKIVLLRHHLSKSFLEAYAILYDPSFLKEEPFSIHHQLRLLIKGMILDKMLTSGNSYIISDYSRNLFSHIEFIHPRPMHLRGSHISAIRWMIIRHMLEQNLSKHDLLYLTLLHKDIGCWEKNRCIVGLNDAALFFLRKPASKLTFYEFILLVQVIRHKKMESIRSLPSCK